MSYSLRTAVVLFIGFALAGGGVSAAESKDRANVLVRPGRDLLKSLKIAQDAAVKGGYADAVVELRKIANPTAGDGFLPLDSLYGSQRTIKSEAIRLLDAMPPQGRQLYEMQGNAEAQGTFDEAMRRGDRRALAEIAKRYLPAPLAVEVALLLAHNAFDRGKPAESLSWLHLLEAAPSAAKKHEVEITVLKLASYLSLNEPYQARAALDRLRATKPPTTFRLGLDKHTTADPPEKLLASLAGVWKNRQTARGPALTGDWPLFRGDATRNAATAWIGELGQRRWKAGILEGPDMQQIHRWKRTDADDVLFCSLQPLVVGDVLLVRSPRRLAAFDLRSGRKLWENPPTIKKKNAKNEEDIAAELWQRFWEDAPFGQLSSNRSEVFLIDGLGLAQSGNGTPRLIAVAGGRLQVVAPRPVEPYNRLVALSLRQQGKLTWSVGGVDGEQEPQLAGYFFLGPPLPYERKLYVLAEKDDLIRLCVLNAASGKLEWSLVLAQVESPVIHDPVRRLAGASPSLANGILICPTSAGAIAAVDPATQSLLWGFQYPVVVDQMKGSAMGLILPNGQVPSARKPSSNRTVRDSSVVMAGGRTFLLPVESEQLYCLNSANGELLWSCPREEMSFIAGVTADKVVLVGPRGLFARNVQTGKTAWREECIELFGKAQTIGRGFLAGQYYYLPNTWNEMVKFDLNAGRIVERFAAKSQLGNTIAAGNFLISSTGDAIQVFSPAEKPKAK